MGYSVKFGDLPEPLQAISALNNIIEYMGGENFAKVTADLSREVRAGRLDADQFAIVASFAGVQGFPVRVWWNYCRHDLLAAMPLDAMEPTQPAGGH